MKLLCLMLSVLFSSPEITFGKIKNGYKDIEGVNASLTSLKLIMLSNSNLTADQSHKIKDKIKVLTNYIIYFELTKNLITQFKTIAPDLYDAIDSIVDKNGNQTDVYIKFMLGDRAAVQHPGTTCIIYNEGDNTNYSEFGAHTVSVKIWIMDNALLILAHELGHVKYQVPNLASYDAYYKINYPKNSRPNYLGHSASDPSGKSAVNFEKKFNENYKAYMNTDNQRISPFKIVASIRKKNKETDWTEGASYFSVAGQVFPNK